MCDVTSFAQAVKTYSGQSKRQQLSDLVSEIASEETLPPRPKRIAGVSSPFPQAANPARDGWHEDDQFESMADLPAAPPQRNKVNSYFQSAGSGRVSASVARSSDSFVRSSGKSLNDRLEESLNRSDRSASPPPTSSGSSFDMKAYSNRSSWLDSPLVQVPRLKGGIRNLGNTCYMSAIVQAIVASERFVRDLQSPFWSRLPQFLATQEADSSAAPATLKRESPSDFTTAVVSNSSDGSAAHVDLWEDDKENCSLNAELMREEQVPVGGADEAKPKVGGGKYGKHSCLREMLDLLR